MEAGNKGTHLGGGTSVGLNMYCLLSSISIILIEIKPEFDYFFVRKVMFVRNILKFVVMPNWIWDFGRIV
jgi:predicted Rossmann-fold nucleotide-binding protein